MLPPPPRSLIPPEVVLRNVVTSVATVFERGSP